MRIEPRVKGFICTTAHPEGCKAHVKQQIDYMKQQDIKLIVKGLRAISDFEAEFQMALMNRKLNSQAETIFLMTANENSYLSSSLVKEIYRLGGAVEVSDAFLEQLSGKPGCIVGMPGNSLGQFRYGFARQNPSLAHGLQIIF